MNHYKDYFENLLSRIWLGESKLDSKVELTHIEDIYLELNSKEKIIILGKTEKYYFILECFNSDGFYYSNGLFNDDMKILINAYKDKERLTNGADVDSFISSILLSTKLEKNLSKTVEKIKKIKI